MRGVGDHAGLRAGERLRLVAELGDRHRDQRHRDPLAGGEQHVELARRRQRRHLLGEVAQLVGGVAHRGDDDDDVVARLAGVDDPLGDPLDAGRVGDRRSAVLLHDNAHGLSSSSVRPRRSAHPRRGRRVYRGGPVVLGVRASHRPAASCSSSPVDVGVEPVVGDHREQRVERGAGEVAPRGDVGELPPPQRLVDVADAVVAQAVLEVGRDAGQVVGELAVDHLGDVGVEDEAVGVDAVEHARPSRSRISSRSGSGPTSGWYSARGVKSRCAPSRAPASSTWLISSSSSEIAAAAVGLAGDRLQRDQEALDLVGDLLRRTPRSLERRPPRVGRLGPQSSADRLPANARPSVTSSAYSRSPPTGSPLANRVTRNPAA